MAFFAKSRRKLRTKNFEAHFHRKLRTLEKCSNVKKLRTTEPQPIFTGSYKKKCRSFESRPKIVFKCLIIPNSDQICCHRFQLFQSKPKYDYIQLSSAK